jgi:hypothetical protein
MRLGMGERRMGVGGSEEISLLLMEAFLIDFSSILQCLYICSGYTHLGLLSQDTTHASKVTVKVPSGRLR